MNIDENDKETVKRLREFVQAFDDMAFSFLVSSGGHLDSVKQRGYDKALAARVKINDIT